MIEIPTFLVLIVLGIVVWVFSVMNNYDTMMSFMIVSFGVFEAVMIGSRIYIGSEKK